MGTVMVAAYRMMRDLMGPEMAKGQARALLDMVDTEDDRK